MVVPPRDQNGPGEIGEARPAGCTYSGDSRMKKLGGGTAGPRKKAYGPTKISLLHGDFPMF